MSEMTTGTGAPISQAGEPNGADSTAANTGQPADGATAPGATPTAPDIPASYEFKLPDGMELDKAAADQFTEIAKELKLDQGTAQKVADVAVAMQQRQIEAHRNLVEGWAQATKTDKDIGGEKLAENLAIARKAIDTFGSPELRQVLDTSGLGNHPAVIKAFMQAGKAISEANFVTGQAPSQPEDPAKKLFPNMN